MSTTKEGYSTVKGVIILKSVTNDDLTSEQLLSLEQFLNNEVALSIYDKFKIGIRVHL